MCIFDDRETVAQISENICMQSFRGYSSFSNQGPFEASLLIIFRKRWELIW
ncbi:MAG: transposase [Bacteroidales bacterium]|nr:transposase [Bacteroidales bacterium]